LLCHENLAAISAWRDDLDEAQRRRQNHPDLVWQAWRRATKAGAPAPTRQQVAQRVAAARKGRAIFWPQDALRRAHQAMLTSRSTDLLVLARLALQAAVHTEDDLLALLAAYSPDRPRWA
jgi:hypothetical protein